LLDKKREEFITSVSHLGKYSEDVIGFDAVEVPKYAVPRLFIESVTE